MSSWESQVDQLAVPRATGVAKFDGFVDGDLLRGMQAEAEDQNRIKWRDNHETFENARGMTIVQNHDVYALNLAIGDQSYLDLIPSAVEASTKVQRFITGLSSIFPSLVDWQYNELSLHRYDDPKLGLSFHKDNKRFIRLIAILSVDGECDLLTRKGEGKRVTTLPASPGDLFLLRAPELITPRMFRRKADLRPEHSVVNLRTLTRTSLMLRLNKRPSERLKGFEFDNWPLTDEEKRLLEGGPMTG